MDSSNLLIVIVAISGSYFSIWLGCFLLSRTRRWLPRTAAILGLWCLSGFLFGEGALAIEGIKEIFIVWLVLTRTGGPLFIACFIHLYLLLFFSDLGQKWKYIVPTATYTFAIIFAVLGVIPGSFFEFYPLFISFLFFVIIIVTFYRLKAIKWHPQKLKHMQLLAISILFFLLGSALSFVSLVNKDIAVLEPLGLFSICMGVLILGINVREFGFLFEGTNIRRDFLYSLSGTAVLVSIYLIVLSVPIILSSYKANLLGIGALAIFTHTLLDFGKKLLDTIFYRDDPQRREMRDASRNIATVVMSRGSNFFDLDKIPEEGFNHMVRKAISDLSHLPRLAESELVNLNLIAVRVLDKEDTPLQRAAELRRLLEELIEALKPPGQGLCGTSEEWQDYNCLHYPYICGATPAKLPEKIAECNDDELRKVLNWLHQQPAKTISNWQKEAVKGIALQIKALEVKLLARRD